MGEILIDRAYINSPELAKVGASGAEIISKPWKLRDANSEMYSKADFKLDMRAKVIT